MQTHRQAGWFVRPLVLAEALTWTFQSIMKKRKHDDCHPALPLSNPRIIGLGADLPRPCQKRLTEIFDAVGKSDLYDIQSSWSRALRVVGCSGCLSRCPT